MLIDESIMSLLLLMTFNVMIINLHLMSSGQELSIWRHRKLFLEFVVYLHCLFQNNSVIEQRKGSWRAWHRDRLLKAPVTSHSVLTRSDSPMFWCHATSQELNSAAVIQTQNLLQNVVLLSPLLSLPASITEALK
jgi:hypothetical protein